MLDSVTLVATDFDRAVTFYDAVLGALGLARSDELVDEEEDDAAVEAVAWGPIGGPGVLWLVTGSSDTTGVHLRLRAGSRAEVETFFDVGVRSGGSAHSAPRRWPIYRRGEFNAIVRDPSGNLVEAVAPEELSPPL